MDPVAGAEVAISDGGYATSVSDIVSYYSSCVGVSPLQADLDAAQAEVSALLASFAADYQNAVDNIDPDSVCLTSAATQVNALNSTLQTLLAAADCPPLQSAWSEGVEQGICTDGFSGFFRVLVVQALTLLLFLLVLGGLQGLYAFFREPPVVDSADEDDEEDAQAKAARGQQGEDAERPLLLEDVYAQDTDATAPARGGGGGGGARSPLAGGEKVGSPRTL